MKQPNGQGLLEMIIATGVILVSLITTLGLILLTRHASQVSKNQILARNLAREGIEVVRSIRDSNWLAFDSGTLISWNEGLESIDDYSAVSSLDPDTGTWTLLFTPDETDMQTNLTVIWFNRGTPPDSGVYTQFDPASPRPGFEPTNYWRLLRLNPICWKRDNGRAIQSTETIAPEGANCSTVTDPFPALPGTFEQVGIAVSSVVRWREQTKTHDTELVEYIYNWKQ